MRFGFVSLHHRVGNVREPPPTTNAVLRDSHTFAQDILVGSDWDSLAAFSGGFAFRPAHSGGATR